MAATSLAGLFEEVRACRRCAAHLPLGPRPVVRGSATSRLLIIGQAPGTKVHASGIPWDDRSGQRLRSWLGLSAETFYDEARVAIMPMGFCYPGRDPNGGDLPPRPECAPIWHDRLRSAFVGIRLTLLVGGYAQRHYLKSGGGVAATVARFAEGLPDFFPLPHPSWRTTAWEAANPWFAAQLLPELRRRVADCL